MKDRPQSTTETYTLKVSTVEPENEELLVKLGFEREWDNEPFMLCTNSFQEMMNALSLLQEEEDYEGSWTLTKKEE